MPVDTPQPTLTPDTLRAAVARAICRAFFYCDLDKPDGIAHWRANKARCEKEADAALRAIVQAAGLDATDLHRAAYETDVGPLARHDDVAALLRALAAAAPPEAAG